MSKQQVAEHFAKASVEVKRIVKFGNTFRVTINWRHFLKIRDDHAFRGYELVMK